MSARVGVVVRPAISDDATALATLWSVGVDREAESHDTGVSAPQPPSPTAAEAASAMEYNAAVNGHHITVALIDGTIVGAAIHQIATLSPVSSVKTLAILDLRVSDSRRKRATELALIGHLTTQADESGCELVTATAPSSDREAHRLLTRLGFSQSLIVRSVRISRLMARVTTSTQPTSRETGRLVAVRRTMRRRHDSRSTPFESLG